MRRRITFSLTVVLSTFGLLSSVTAAPQQVGGTEHPSASSITEDLSNGATLRFQIAPGLPEFTFKVIAHWQQSDDRGNAQSTVLNIQVLRGNSPQPLQSLTGCDFSEMEPPPKGSVWFRTDDFNFDGYKDVYIMTAWGATGNAYGCVWLYDPMSGRFAYSKDLSGLASYKLDPATKTIFTFEKGGMAGTIYTAHRYTVENNRPVLFWSERQDWDDTKQQFHCVEQQRRGNQMQTIRDKWGTSGEDAAPCDPSNLFDRPKAE